MKRVDDEADCCVLPSDCVVQGNAPYIVKLGPRQGIDPYPDVPAAILDVPEANS